MTATELYDRLNKAGLAFEVLDIFDGFRAIGFVVEEEPETDDNEEE